MEELAAAGVATDAPHLALGAVPKPELCPFGIVGFGPGVAVPVPHRTADRPHVVDAVPQTLVGPCYHHRLSTRKPAEPVRFFEPGQY